MMFARMLPRPVAKEVRALLPVWLGCVVAVGAVVRLSVGGSVLTYVMGSVALGALSVGHEYNQRTLLLLLTQPANRARVFLVKQSVLVVMLLTLAGVMWASVSGPSRAAAFIITLSVLGGLFVAPWLTMLSRNPLAGTVFTLGIPGLLWILVDGLVAEQLKLVVLLRGLLVISAIAAVMSWLTFMRLEAVEGRGLDLRFPMARADLVPGRRGHPLWLLAKKELGLQQLSIAVAGIASLAWLAMFLFGLLTWSRRPFEDPVGAVTFLYSGLLAMVIGSLASAEERQLGTFEWQILLPLASWKQWAVKVGMALSLALLLAVALPALLLSLSGGPVRISEWYACVILLLTSASLYVSSLSTSGVRALLVSLPASWLVLFAAMGLAAHIGWIQLSLLHAGLFGLFLAIVLYFAHLNHRSAERGAWRVCQQIFCIVGSFLFGGAVLMLVNTVHGRWLR